jgi:hypothetical protein
MFYASITQGIHIGHPIIWIYEELKDHSRLSKEFIALLEQYTMHREDDEQQVMECECELPQGLELPKPSLNEARPTPAGSR